jgi:hypothetical protein
MSGHGGSRPGSGRKRKLPVDDSSVHAAGSGHGGARLGAGRPKTGQSGPVGVDVQLSQHGEGT